MRRLCSVSVDLDPLPCYYRIYALGESPPALRDIVRRTCVPRFADVLAARGIRATFFIVAEDLDTDPGARALYEQLAAAGHELANHSYQHYYELARMPRATVADEIERAHDRIGEIAGGGVVGFRAPGYDLSADMLDELMRLGYLYDSSLFPAPGYYAVKAAVMGALALSGRPSGAVLTNPRGLLAPADPYRPDATAPWRKGQAPIVELPIGVTPVARTPAIGTNLLLAPQWLRRRWLRAMRGRPFFNFELHGIDLADAATDGFPPDLIARQADLRAAGDKKRRALEDVLDALAAEGYEFATLRDVAAEVQREGAIR
jgi:peptidoglycan/xylan/chitin deacetylase (PgdA/CDA1 family)